VSRTEAFPSHWFPPVMESLITFPLEAKCETHDMIGTQCSVPMVEPVQIDPKETMEREGKKIQLKIS